MGTSVEPDLDLALDGAVGSMYEELHRHNRELRTAYHQLRTEHEQLRIDGERLRETLSRVCCGLEDLTMEIRTTLAETPQNGLPHKGTDLEAENEQLRKATNALSKDVEKMR